MIPTHNRAALLPRAIKGVLAQSASPFEVVVVDDGSTDDTASVLEAIGDARVRTVHQAQAGVAAARNHGARVATGEVLLFLDDDDDVEPSWLQALTDPFADPSIALVSCASIHCQPDGSQPRESPVRDLGAAYDHIQAKFDTGTYAVRRDAFEAAGGFAEEVASGEHHELGLRLVDVLAARSWRSTFVSTPLVTIHDRASIDRSSNDPHRLLTSALYFVDHHRQRLARNPNLLANYLAIAGVSAARLGDFPKARRLLGQAARTQPTRVKHYGRWLLAAVPPFGRRVWRADQWQGVTTTQPAERG